jgi:hypothetical protein
MRCAFAVVGFLAGVLVSIPCRAVELQTGELLDRWQQANGLCRGGSGEETMAWCTVRDGIGDVLSIRGWCYGKQGQAGFEMQWHPCGPDSNRPEPDLLDEAE